MKIPFKLFLVLYLFVGVVPNLEALDKVVTQWFYLNFLNTIALMFLVFREYPVRKFLSNRLSILFFCLLIWSALTALFSINAIESIVVLSQFFAIVIGFVIILICISKIDNAFDFISNIISIILIIELALIYSPFIFDFGTAKNLIFSRSSSFLGIAANVNITAFSIIYKIPFVIYSSILYKKFLFPFLLIIFSLIIFASGTLNSTRAAIITYTSLAPILFLIGLVIYFKSRNNKLLLISLIYILSISFSFPLNSYLSESLGKSESKITNRLSTLNALIDDESQDSSISERRAFYSQAINFIIENPIFGTGLGNWKIKSIDTNKENIIGYMVPYHAHNDYLEIASEIGLVGLGIYLSILFLGFKNVINKFLRMIFTNGKLEENYLISIAISLFLFIFFIDSNINFPFHRPLVFINVIVLLAYLNYKKSSNIYEK